MRYFILYTLIPLAASISLESNVCADSTRKARYVGDYNGVGVQCLNYNDNSCFTNLSDYHEGAQGCELFNTYPYAPKGDSFGYFCKEATSIESVKSRFIGLGWNCVPANSLN
jgi:hypothetical protein